MENINEVDKTYMYEMITAYWGIIKKHGCLHQSVHDGELHNDINDFYMRFKVNAPCANISNMAQELVDGLVMLYET